MTASQPAAPPGRIRRSAIACILVCGALFAACTPAPRTPKWPALGGDSGRGEMLVKRYSCGACHEMPGIEGAHGLVGPPLGDFARRTMIAGMLPNIPDNLILWLRHPQSVTPGNAMPDVGLTNAQARDIAAYLYEKRR